ncbi:trimethyllysine dioxygenase, mitochondrial-like [Asterias rubens]|uniref:trimethyllysine dioxygenase, mitochondrial-like n=1 Tax=Asterias rubens TaxID=7604 RepID=UPI001455CB12|nr:trimethyllysine dioxygenase, mitochondrial-like [Asterias rubens]XP_033637292.1 trimethyllysine dioxygenase, mitochondrial-like [Asterias rubens]XP_033637293.1 trimethyllysine dioxygenase, mitochondrial-like [Asterias rubens]XP_033637294.1 trimethyllysine dioxygenase, mitochondrial-like [Asterias rubens]XP_033637295.1 trimethyllysine dioxygenase, mitochondrial-like [Asterias rubens]XP_033637296.1 trimethyllysine dioxygenase, mitochondrial-like [Asterias rubens]
MSTSQILKTAHAVQHDRRVKVTYEEFLWDLSYIWLRDHCRCAECHDSGTSQQLVDTFSISLDIKPQQLTCQKDGLNLIWPDSHLTKLPWQWLVENAPGGQRAIDGMAPLRVYWDCEKMTSMLPPDIPYKEFIETEAGLKEAVERFYKFGLVFFEGNRPNTEDVQKAANRLSRLQETFYGGVCVVTADNEIADLAYSSAKLSCHTDTTYFTQPAGAMLFTCFKHDGLGGENPLVDGFHAAAKLKETHPEHYQALSTIPLSACYKDKERHMEMHFTTLNHDPVTGQLINIRYNNSDRAPLSHLSPDDVDRFYAAHQAFAAILQSPASEFVVKLNPGRLMLIDNWRCLHGRIGFTGHRIMTSCYLQRDEINSKIRTILGVKD